MPVTISNLTDEAGKPVSLTPEEQAEVDQLSQSVSYDQIASSPAAIPQEPPALLSAYKPPQFQDDQGNPVKLSPAESAEARKQANTVDPLLDLSPEEMAELARQQPEQFNILMALQARPDAKEDPAAVQRIAEGWRIYRDKTGLGDINLKNIPENLWGMAKGLVSYGKDMPQPASLDPRKTIAEVQNLVRMVETGDLTPEQLERVRGLTENVYATALSLEGLARQGKNLVGKMDEGIARLPGMPGKPQAQRDVEKLFEDEALLEGTQQLAMGKRELLPGLNRLTKYLEEKGAPLRPEKIQEKSAGDPLTFYLFGKAFGAVSKAMPTVISEQALARAGEATATGVGKVAEVTGQVGQKVIPPVAKVLPVATAIKGGVLGGSVGSVTGGVAAGYATGKVLAKGLMAKVPLAKSLESVGRQIAGKEAVKSHFAQFAKDVAREIPATGYEVGKGLAADVAMTFPAETPEEMQGIGIGAGFGLFGGASRMGARAVRGQVIGPRAYGSSRAIPTNNVFPSLKPLHDAAYQSAEPGVQTRLNGLREMVRGAFPEETEFIYVPKPEIPVEEGPLGAAQFLEGTVPMEGGLPGTPPATRPTQADPLVPALLQIRGPDGKPVMTPDRAQALANANGLVSIVAGNKRLILVRDIEAAPHEAVGHVMEHALGESTMRQVDSMIQSNPKYQGQTWEAIAQGYADRVGGKTPWNPATESWQDFLLSDRVSAWGPRAAKENVMRQQFGEGPYTEAQANAAWADYQRKNPGATWETVLTDAEKSDLANRYVSREIFAENMDAAFKHGISPDPDLTTKLVRVVADFIRYLGGDPMMGATSESLGIPLSHEIIKLQRGMVEKVQRAAPKPVIEPTGKAPRGAAKARGVPTTPEQQTQAADEAATIASTAPDTVVAAGGTKTAREILGLVAEAIAKRGGVKINYSSAPDEPAAAITSNRVARRSIIEAFRSMPEAARALWEKSFFPERVLQLKNGQYQVLGWSPEVFAANAHKTALAISDMIAVDPRYAGLTPYPIDPKTGSFTPEGWQQLYTDTQQFVRNQIAGRTGSGLPLVVPKGAAEEGAFAPSLQAGGALEQSKADFISSLYNFKLPETARITGGKMPLNVIGAEVSEATLPGRTVEPIRPRATFEGEQAQALGIEGQPILEVNPFRQALETAAKETGTPVPSLIEAIQRLNLDRIKELEHAPELPEFRGNTLTLTAGFMPSNDPRALRAAAVKDRRTGQEFTGTWHGDAFAKALDAGLSSKRSDYIEGFVTNTPKEFLDRDQATQRGLELNQIQEGSELSAKTMGAGIEHLKMEELTKPGWGTQATGPQAEPAPAIQDLVNSVHNTTAEQWQQLVRSPEKRGASSYAHEAGMRARTPADLALLKSTYDMLGDLGIAAMKAKEPALALEYGVKKQAIREAYEAATGRTMDGKEDVSSTIRELHDPNYEPPVPAKVSEPTGQFQVRTERGRDLEKEGFRFEHSVDRFGNRRLVVTKHGELAGELTTKPTDKETEAVKLVKVEPSFRGQGLAEALYREVAAQLQEEGITKLTGEVIHRAPLHIREKLFGEPKDIEPEFESESGFMRVVESEIPATAQFAPKEDRKLAPPFYSQLGRVIEQKFTGASMPSDQLANMLRNPQSGVKPEELKWSGLEDFLKDNPRVTKAEVQEFLAQNQVQVKEVTRAGVEGMSKQLAGFIEQNRLIVPDDPESWQRMADIIERCAQQWQANGDNARANRLWELRQEALEKAEGVSPTTSGVTKFEQYQLPGGENYREILFTLPRKEVLPVARQKQVRGDLAYKLYQQGDTIVDAETGREVAGHEIDNARYYRVTTPQEAAPFTSGHWDEPNVLAHTRINDRTDSNGEAGLFIEEIQSDWHQKGRKEGYTTPVEDTTGWTAEKVADTPHRGEGRWRITDNEGDFRGHAIGFDAEEAIAHLANRDIGKVPDAPFKNTWHEMVFRRMIRQAAEEGKKWLGWTTGEQQADRYDLSKHIGELRVSKLKDGRVGLDALEPKTARLIISKAVPAERVADYVGKDLAEKIAAQKESYHEYSGLDLKVGGEGMRGFYDKILVDYANKFGKKFGARVSPRKVDVDVGAQGYPEAVTVHALPITPEMSRSVLQEGVAQFMPREERYRTPEDIESADTRFKDTFFPIGFTDTQAKAPTLITDAAKQINSEGAVRIVYHGDKSALNLFAFGPEGEDAASVFSRMISPTEAIVYTSRGEGALAKVLRTELETQLEQQGLKVVPEGTEPAAQGIFGLEGIEKLNRREVERQQRQAEQETTRLSSFAGDIRSGLVLHSAKQRSTVHLTPEESKDFLKAYNAADTRQDKSSVVERYFEEGSALGAQFAPGKDKEWKLKAPGTGAGAFSKAWITPEGKPVILGGQYHHVWMAEHPEIRKKYGLPTPTDLATGGGEEIREAALKKGFARINYSVNSGELTVEARAKDWPTLRPAIERMARANAGKMDAMTVHLFDNNVKRMVDSGHEQLFRYSDKEKLSHLPLISAPSETTEMSAQASSAQMLPGQRTLGRTEDDLSVRGTVVPKGEIFASHEQAGMPKDAPGGTNWRYDHDRKTLFWWAERSELDPEVAAETKAWLAKKGLPVKKTKFLNEFDDPGLDAYAEAHTAQFAPAKLEDFNKEETLPAALAKPGWAILTGTQKALGAFDTPENIKANAELKQQLADEGYDFKVIAGTYEGKPDGDSFLVVGITPEEASAIGNQYKQDSVLVPEGLLYADKTLNPVKPEGNVIGGEAKKQPYFSTTPEGVSFSMGLDFEKKVSYEPTAQFEPERRREGLLPDIGKPEPLSSSQVAGMTKDELAAHYPEAVIPRRYDEPIPSAILESPLVKRSKDPVAAFAQKLVEFAQEYQDHPSFQSGLKWYSEFVPKLKKVFGKDAPVMAELLAGTSPQQPPAPNYAMALDAYQGWKTGRFEKQIAGFERGLDKVKDGSWESWLNREIKSGALKNPPETPTEETFINHWVDKNNLLPRQSNGKLYGISSDAVLKVLARRWLENTSGLKTQNFVQNLLGTGHEATIDLWADRTMRRIGYSEAKPRWRILPKNATGVSDPDFKFAQSVFRAAAKELGVRPDALQGGLWFAEKQLWADNGWGRLDLGDYRVEIKKTEMLKSGIEHRLARVKAARRARPVEQLGLDIVEPRPILNP